MGRRGAQGANLIGALTDVLIDMACREIGLAKDDARRVSQLMGIVGIAPTDNTEKKRQKSIQVAPGVEYLPPKRPNKTR